MLLTLKQNVPPSINSVLKSLSVLPLRQPNPDSSSLRWSSQLSFHQVTWTSLQWGKQSPGMVFVIIYKDSIFMNMIDNFIAWISFKTMWLTCCTAVNPVCFALLKKSLRTNLTPLDVISVCNLHHYITIILICILPCPWYRQQCLYICVCYDSNFLQKANKLKVVIYNKDLHQKLQAMYRFCLINSILQYWVV